MFRYWLPALLAFAFVTACGGSTASSPSPTSSPAATATESPSATLSPPTATFTATAVPSPTPTPVHEDIRATHLTVPALGIDSEVQAAPTVPYVYVPDPGCPPEPADSETVDVPTQGIATPEDSLEGLENKAWIFGHSRWSGVPGIFFSLVDVSLGDELFIDGVDRESGLTVTAERFVVDGIYLADTDSGETLLTSEDAADIPQKPIVVLQTSVRERGVDRPWILDRQALLAKATNLVQGDLDDPCKYLLLFVTASQS
jgi:hypothetical protein